MKTYAEVTQWLFSQLPVYQNQGASAYKPGLEKMQAFAAHLGNPQQDFASIHVAGTNGKGSTSHMLAAALQSMGYKVGLYTSPHLLDFSERIRMNGKVVDQSFIVDFVLNHKDYFIAQQLSFFEITVGMAFAYFAQEQVDYAVVEVGLGGRLDATNIITPKLAVITNIGLDHTEFLGDNLADIAREKAGVIKANIPVVVGETTPLTLAVFEEKAKVQNAELVLAEEQEVPEFPIDLLGAYQEKNRRTAFTTLNTLFNQSVPALALEGFANIAGAGDDAAALRAYRAFLALAVSWLSGTVGQERYEDAVRQLMGNECYPLFSIDILVSSALRHLGRAVSDKHTAELLDLSRWSFKQEAGFAADKSTYYQRARGLLKAHKNVLVRLE